MLKRSQPVNYVQENPSTTWIIPHTLGEIVAVDVFVDLGEIALEKILAPTKFEENQVTISFSQPMKGKARVV